MHRKKNRDDSKHVTIEKHQTTKEDIKRESKKVSTEQSNQKNHEQNDNYKPYYQ
jgi:hypothetical protein